LSITALMYVIRNRATIHDSNRRYCNKHVPDFDRCKSVSFSPCSQNARRGFKMIVWATKTTNNSQKPDDFGWKGETRISKNEEEINENK